MDTNTNQDNPTQPLSPNSGISNSMVSNPQVGNKFVKPLVYFIGAVVFMVIGALGFYLYQNEYTKVSDIKTIAEPNKDTVITSPSTVVTQSTTTQIITPSNTKLYTNNELGYSVQIPSTWDTEGKGSFLNIPGEVTILPPGEKSKEGYQTVIAITTMTTGKIRYSINTQQQFDEWKDKPISDGAGERLYKTAIVNVDGIDAVQFISRALPGDQTEAFYSIVTWFRKDNVNYYIEFGGVESIVKNYRSVYNNVISSFRFGQ